MKIAGFQTAGVAAGIKDSGLDVGLMVAQQPVATAAVFTTNSVVAAPVTLSKKHLENGYIQAIVVNSGNANCVTGKQGMKDAGAMAKHTAKIVGCDQTDVIVASTGIIGKNLPIDRITNGIKEAADQLKDGSDDSFETSILTTDTTTKTTLKRTVIHNTEITITGCAKGSGMIEPNMATMLAFLATDAKIEPDVLDQALRSAVEPSFNSITVDGCMSTNDMVSIMASGAAENELITQNSSEYENFLATLTEVCTDLALQIIRDAEGATTLLEVHVEGAANEADAKKIGKSIANSPLVKTALHANPPNWGRIAQAVGSMGFDITEDNLQTEVERPDKDHVILRVKTNLGNAHASVYGCDLTKEYVAINEEYN